MRRSYRRGRSLTTASAQLVGPLPVSWGAGPPVWFRAVACPSGRRCNTRNVVWGQTHRGFKSHRHRRQIGPVPRGAGPICDGAPARPVPTDRTSVAGAVRRSGSTAERSFGPSVGEDGRMRAVVIDAVRARPEVRDVPSPPRPAAGSSYASRRPGCAAATGTRGRVTTTSPSRTCRDTSSPGPSPRSARGHALAGRRPGDRPVRVRVRPLRVVPVGPGAGLPRPAAARLHALGLVRRARRPPRRRHQPRRAARRDRLRDRREPRVPVRHGLPRARRPGPGRRGRVGHRRRGGRGRAQRGDDRPRGRRPGGRGGPQPGGARGRRPTSAPSTRCSPTAPTSPRPSPA